jgi:hypothetical protein
MSILDVFSLKNASRSTVSLNVGLFGVDSEALCDILYAKRLFFTGIIE